LLVILSHSTFAEVNWHALLFYHVGVLQEHVQESVDFLASSFQEIAVKCTKPLLAWESRHARSTFNQVFDGFLELEKTRVPVFNVERDIPGVLYIIFICHFQTACLSMREYSAILIKTTLLTTMAPATVLMGMDTCP